LDLLPNIPRSGSAIMLNSFFRVALMVTDGVEEFGGERAEILDFYENNDDEWGNVDDWMDSALEWTSLSECGDGYYGNNITMEPMYNWARLEDDTDRLRTIREDLLGGPMWEAFDSTKNSFFSYIYAANVPSHSEDVETVALEQLTQFPVPPRIKVERDLRDDERYFPHEEGCTDQVSHETAVDVADRCVSDFIWQRHPWGLYCSGDLHQTYPGVDYMVAYWMGRWHDFIDDDRPGTCLAWH